jgi:hypothetical protein
MKNKSESELPLAEASRRPRLNPPSCRFPRMAGRPGRVSLQPRDPGEAVRTAAISHPDEARGERHATLPLSTHSNPCFSLERAVTRTATTRAYGVIATRGCHDVFESGERLIRDTAPAAGRNVRLHANDGADRNAPTGASGQPRAARAAPPWLATSRLYSPLPARRPSCVPASTRRPSSKTRI